MRATITVRLSPSRLRILNNGVETAGRASAISRRRFASCAKREAVWGFVGLGRMGFPMAKNLRAKIPEEDTLLIHDRNAEATGMFAEEMRGKGVEVVESSRELAERSQTIITVLPSPTHITSLFHTLLSTPLPPSTPTRLFIDCSTIDPTTSRSIANAIHCTTSGRFVDAPMSGGVVGARASTLTFMLGASSKTGSLVARVKPILELMGKRVIHMGEQGAGLSGKLANNYLLAISNIATAEAMNLGLKLGLERKKLGELINSSSGRCWSSEVNNPVPGVVRGAPAEKDYEGGFGVGLMKKDLKLAVQAAREVGARLELAERAVRVYEDVEMVEGGKDFSVVYKWLGGKL